MDFDVFPSPDRAMYHTLHDSKGCRTAHYSSLETLLARYAPGAAPAQLALHVYDHFFEVYRTALDHLAKGHKDLGLRFLYALRSDLGQLATHDREIVQMKNNVPSTIALWGTGFDWT